MLIQNQFCEDSDAYADGDLLEKAPSQQQNIIPEISGKLIDQGDPKRDCQGGKICMKAKGKY